MLESGPPTKLMTILHLLLFYVQYMLCLHIAFVTWLRFSLISSDVQPLKFMGSSDLHIHYMHILIIVRNCVTVSLLAIILVSVP